MSLKVYIFGLMAGMLLSLAIWLFVVFSINPYNSGLIGQILFFAGLFLFLLGLWINIFVWLRAKFLGSETAMETMNLSFRQGLLLSILIVILLILNLKGFLVWWVGLLVTTGIFLVELFFLSRDK